MDIFYGAASFLYKSLHQRTFIPFQVLKGHQVFVITHCLTQTNESNLYLQNPICLKYLLPLHFSVSLHKSNYPPVPASCMEKSFVTAISSVKGPSTFLLESGCVSEFLQQYVHSKGTMSAAQGLLTPTPASLYASSFS